MLDLLQADVSVVVVGSLPRAGNQHEKSIKEEVSGERTVGDGNSNHNIPELFTKAVHSPSMSFLLQCSSIS